MCGGSLQGFKGAHVEYDVVNDDTKVKVYCTKNSSVQFGDLTYAQCFITIPRTPCTLKGQPHQLLFDLDGQLSIVHC